MVPPATLRHVEPLPRRTTSAGTRAVPTEIALWLLDSGGPHVDIAIPVYNEEADLEASVRRLHAYLSTELPFSFRITVADNASTAGSRCNGNNVGLHNVASASGENARCLCNPCLPSCARPYLWRSG